MICNGKKNILGVLVDVVDYEAAIEQIIRAARDHRGFAVSAAAVHAVMEGVVDPVQKYRLNHLDLVTPDGQPVRWALNLLHHAGLRERVYGPDLMLRLCDRAEKENLGVYLYGNTQEVLSALRIRLKKRFPGLRIVGTEPSKFRQLSPQERDQVTESIRESEASLIFVGLGCPRHEIWAFEYRDLVSVPIIAVGGAFGVLAGKVPQAPEWMQRRGLEWLFRLHSEPRRLWRRYLLLNPAYASLVVLQAVGLHRCATAGQRPSTEALFG